MANYQPTLTIEHIQNNEYDLHISVVNDDNEAMEVTSNVVSGANRTVTITVQNTGSSPNPYTTTVKVFRQRGEETVTVEVKGNNGDKLGETSADYDF